MKSFETSEKIDKIAEALVSLQENFSNPTKDAQAHHGKYANLEGVIKHARGPCAQVGITIFQQALTDEKGNLGVLTRLLHNSGQYFQSFISTNINDGRDVGRMCQEHGKLISYYRRYQILSALFLKDEDDDGDSANKNYSRNEGRKTGTNALQETPETGIKKQQNKNKSEVSIEPNQGNPSAEKFSNDLYVKAIKQICNKDDHNKLKGCMDYLGLKFTSFIDAQRFLHQSPDHGGAGKEQRIKVIEFVSR